MPHAPREISIVSAQLFVVTKLKVNNSGILGSIHQLQLIVFVGLRIRNYRMKQIATLQQIKGINQCITRSATFFQLATSYTWLALLFCYQKNTANSIGMQKMAEQLLSRNRCKTSKYEKKNELCLRVRVI